MKIVKTHLLKALITTAVVAALLPLLAGSLTRSESVVTVVVVAKDMKFNQTNPTIFIRPGTKIRMVLRNEDPGMRHDLVLEALGLETPIIKAGESAVLEFEVEDEVSERVHGDDAFLEEVSVQLFAGGASGFPIQKSKYG